MERSFQRALVIGASSGIGEALARELAAQGSGLALVARREDLLERIAGDARGPEDEKKVFIHVHDVRNTGEVPDLLQQIAAELGGLDLVIYSSGVMPAPAFDEYPTEEDITAIDVNFAGAVAWLNEVAKRFSLARSGTIIGISSVAGDRGRPGNPVYNATKAALNSYLESLRNRLARRGVTVVTVKPGYVRTAMVQADKLPGFLVADPAVVARQILAGAADGRRVIYTPPWWRYIARLLKMLPPAVLEHLKL